MTSSHVFFIPAMLVVGAIFGYVMGRKMLLQEQEEARRAQARRAARDAALQDDA
ncbi:MAG: hypothetical protein RIT45_1989 [Pseudomonadota bacterium]|jgi:membrane protein YqaA with SNARE-associated domain